jgi:glycosyltransferase involved in cell wall biosynthesis
MEKNNFKIARVATVPFAFLGSRELLARLDKSSDLTVICSKGDYSKELQDNLSKPLKFISIKREISILSDLVSVYNLYRYFKNERFSIVHSNTRIHTFTGQRWATIGGFKRILMKTIDRLICLLNTDVYADSRGQIDFLCEEGIAKAGKIRLLGKGAFAGVSLDRFQYNELNTQEGFDLELKREDKTLLIGFIGRIVKDKGVEILLECLSKLRKENIDVKLLMIGPTESELDPISEYWTNFLEQNKSFIQMTGFINRPELAMAHCDLLCLPSFREGFPMVVLEAAALGKPAIVSEVPGCIDTIVSDETGLSFSLERPNELGDKILVYYQNRKTLQDHGQAAQARVVEHFSQEAIFSNQLKEYERLYEESL